MTAQRGYDYERNAVKALQLYDVIPRGFSPAGANNDIPDLLLKLPGVGNAPVGCELKIKAASAGSIAMYWNKKDKWSIGKEGEKDLEKLFIIDLAKEVGIVKQLNKKWNQEPYKFSNKETGLERQQVYEAERNRFPEINGSVSADNIEKYYNKKKSYYVNVGTNGFYMLGNKNPLRFKNVPTFASAATAKYRARVQPKGRGYYQFTFEMIFSIPVSKNSPYNIAPVMGNTVNIDKELMMGSLKGLFGINNTE